MVGRDIQVKPSLIVLELTISAATLSSERNDLHGWHYAVVMSTVQIEHDRHKECSNYATALALVSEGS